jgi:hypothetical protein
MHTILAFGAYHQRISHLGYTKWKSVHHANSSDAIVQFALHHHAKAAKLIRESLGMINPPLQIIQVACALFIMLEFLQGNRMAAISHLTSGMSLLKYRKASEGTSPFDLWAESTLSRLSLLQSLYGRPRSVRFPVLWIVPLPDEEKSSPSFASVEEARIANFNLNGLVLIFVHKAEQSVDPGTPDMLMEQKYLRNQLTEWEAAVKRLVDQKLAWAEMKVIALLRAHQMLSWIFLQACTTQSQLTYDHHISDFEGILDALEPIITQLMVEHKKPRLFCLELGVIPCLFYTALKCRHPKVRRRAVDLLRKAPRREALWDAEEAALAAEAAIAFEEGGVDGTEDTGDDILPPEERRLLDVDIREPDSAHEACICIVMKSRPSAASRVLQETIVYANVA